jgi:hypothetical protein
MLKNKKDLLIRLTFPLQFPLEQVDFQVIQKDEKCQEARLRLLFELDEAISCIQRFHPQLLPSK